MKIQVLDGGMGTTLESMGQDVSTPMWGCDLVDRDPEAIAAVHKGFATAGADIVETATYQMTVESLVAAGHSEESAVSVMRKAVSLARQSAPSSQIALSLGPFGAMLSPGQEYSGYYPPPYGPKGYVDESGDDINQNYAPPTEDALYETSLRDFHLARLRVYAMDKSTWQEVSWIAFETIPLLREIRAIRRAVASLYEELAAQYGAGDTWWRKPFWVASAYPGGKIGSKGNDGVNAGVAEVAEALVGPLSVDGAAAADIEAVPAPEGLGINCTHPTLVPSLVASLTSAVAQAEGTDRPRLFLYPDGGSMWNAITRSWTPASELDITPASWAADVLAAAKTAKLAQKADATPVWSGVVVGGCCKASFAEITALRSILDAQSRE